MPTMKDAADAFLANKRIAVTGVSRKPKEHGSNTVYKRLRDRGYEFWFEALYGWATAAERASVSSPSPTIAEPACWRIS